MGANSPQAQGAAFEVLLHELLQRVLADDLHYDVTQNALQGSGIQYGKDIQVRWRGAGEVEHFWHFECKSHRGGFLPGTEVAPKLLDVYRSSHRIDVWCLALAHVEPAPTADELLAWANEEASYPFHATVLSPHQNSISELFACHPDLYQQLYPDHEMPDLDRDACIEHFRVFLAESSRRGREQAVRPHGPWEIVHPGRLSELTDDASLAADFLTGRMPTCPWEAVVHGWAVPRPSAANELLAAVTGSAAGFLFKALTGAGGEGKSTLLRQIAWQIARTEGWVVLSADDVTGAGQIALPTNWLEQLPDGSKVLLAVDSVPEVLNVAGCCQAEASYRRRGQHVVVLYAERHYRWHRGHVRSALWRARRDPDRQIKHMVPLAKGEQEALAGELEQRGLLSGKTRTHALQRIAEAAQQARSDRSMPYLLPTIIQLTDPEDRAFDTIIGSIVADLAGEPGRAGFRLLLATATVHASGHGLPRTVAERIVGDGQFAEAIELLDGELSRYAAVGLNAAGYGRPEQLCFTHHGVVADGLVAASAGADSPYREAYLEICEAVPLAMRPDCGGELFVPDYLFEVLDATARYLDLEKGLYPAAARWLMSWWELYDRGFPTLHWLGECYQRWVQHELQHLEAAATDVEPLADAGRDAYARSIGVARDALLGGEVPPQFRQYRFRDHEYRALHGWSVLEGTMAEAWGADQERARSCFLRSILLSLQAMEPGQRDQNAKATGTLSLSLINCGEHDLAAEVTAASETLGNRPAIVARQRRMLRQRGVDLPEGGTELLDNVFASLTTGPLLAEWETVDLYPSRQEHIAALLAALRLARRWIPQPDEIAAAITQLEAEAGGAE